MKHAHSVDLKVFSYENENKEFIAESFLKFFPFNLGDNKVKLKATNAKGINESAITILEVILTKTNLISQFLGFILRNLNESQKRTVLGQIESRLDSNLDFFMRFDKDEWIKNNKLELTDSGKCFHLKISVAAYPHKREVALKIIRKLFNPEN